MQRVTRLLFFVPTGATRRRCTTQLQPVRRPSDGLAPMQSVYSGSRYSPCVSLRPASWPAPLRRPQRMQVAHDVLDPPAVRHGRRAQTGRFAHRPRRRRSLAFILCVCVGVGYIVCFMMDEVFDAKCFRRLLVRRQPPSAAAACIGKPVSNPDPMRSSCGLRDQNSQANERCFGHGRRAPPVTG